MVISLNQYKLYSGKNTPKEDIQLQPIVDLVNTLIPRYCNTKFSPTVETNKLITNTGNILILPNAPVISVENIELKNTSTVLAADQYYLDTDTGIVELLDSALILPRSPRSVSVDYTWGTTEVPEDVVLAAVELVTYYYKREFYKSKTLSSGQSVDYADPSLIPTHVKGILDLYKVL